MTALAILAVALVVVVVLLVKLAQRNEDVADERAELATVRESLRVVTADLDTVTADRARLRALHKLDPDANWDQQVADLTRQLADTGRLLQAETAARVAAQHQAGLLMGELALYANACPKCGHKGGRTYCFRCDIESSDDTEYVEADPAGEIPRVVTLSDWGGE